MQYVSVILWTLLLASVATAQQQDPQPLSDVQLRGLNSACSQDSVGLSIQKIRLEQQVQALTARLKSADDTNAQARARIKELEAKKEEKK